MERNKTIAMCSWDACLECGLFNDTAGCTCPHDLDLSTDGDSVLCESSVPRDGGE